VIPRMPILLRVIPIACTLGAAAHAQSRAADVCADTWTATDALGRTLIGYEEAGPPRSGRFVGIFYFLWLGRSGSTPGPACRGCTFLTRTSPSDSAR
jgi:hypothetical protein